MLDGTGIGIAILDSGVDISHKAFLGNDDRLRVVVNKDFTGEGRTDDPYGHGTHVASIAAGNGRISNGKYLGIAPNASILNLRVLDRQGMLAPGNRYELGGLYQQQQIAFYGRRSLSRR